MKSLNLAIGLGLFVTILQLDLRAQNDVPQYRLEVRRQGPFSIGVGRPKTVTVEISRVHFISTVQLDYPETDVAVSILDQNRKVLFRRNFPAEGGYEMSFSIKPIEIFGIGPVLVWNRSVVPSAPGSGEDGQILGLNALGQIVSLTGIIETRSIKIVYVEVKGAKVAAVLDHPGPGTKAFIEREVWTDYFSAVFYYHIFEGGVTYDDAATPLWLDEIPVRIDTLWARNYRAQMHDGPTTLRLFEKPNDDTTRSQIVHIRAQSSIKFLNAVRPSEWWLHVIVDGIEGYVPTDGMLALGLPLAG